MRTTWCDLGSRATCAQSLCPFCFITVSQVVAFQLALATPGVGQVRARKAQTGEGEK